MRIPSGFQHIQHNMVPGQPFERPFIKEKLYTIKHRYQISRLIQMYHWGKFGSFESASGPLAYSCVKMEHNAILGFGPSSCES